MAVSLSKVFAGPAAALLATVFQGMVAKVVVIPGKFFRGVVCVSCGSLGSVLFLWVLSWFCWGVILCPWGSCSVRVLGPGSVLGSVLGSVDIFKFLLRKKG